MKELQEVEFIRLLEFIIPSFAPSSTSSSLNNFLSTQSITSSKEVAVPHSASITWLYSPEVFFHPVEYGLPGERGQKVMAGGSNPSSSDMVDTFNRTAFSRNLESDGYPNKRKNRRPRIVTNTTLAKEGNIIDCQLLGQWKTNTRSEYAICHS